VVFNRLEEGHYVLHILPRAGATRGAEATLAFTVRPPWFRTPLAWLSYVVLAIGLFSLSVWLIVFLQQRRECTLGEAGRRANCQPARERGERPGEL